MYSNKFDRAIKFKKPDSKLERAFIIQKIKVYLNVNGISAKNLARFIA